MAGTPQNITLKLYQAVIADVISNVKEAFQEEGVDDQVLQELKHIWESKLVNSKALEAVEEETEVAKLPDQKTVQVYQQPNRQQQQQIPSQQVIQQHQQQQQHQHQQQQIQQQQQQQVAPPPPAPASSSNSNSIMMPLQDLNKRIPIQITLPPQQGSTDGQPRVITIQVPASTLQGNQLQSVLGGSVITAAMSVPTDVATVLLQQHVDNVLQQQQQQAMVDTKPPVFGQYDGLADTSDDDSDDDSDDKDDEDDDDQDIDDEENDDNEGIEDEPLNSSDDVSEEDPALFDTENIVVCQYDKITRSRNKWKFYLKDGIMNLNGKDFVFQKANGDADW